MPGNIRNEFMDFRMKWSLKQGDQIHSEGQIYTIIGLPIGYGGSSILYRAIRSDSGLNYVIKECFPAVMGKFIRENGVVTAIDKSGVKLLEQYSAMLEKEKEYGQKIGNASKRAIPIRDRLKVQALIVGGKKCEKCSKAILSVMDCMEGNGLFLSELLEIISARKEGVPSLCTGGLPGIYTTACIIEEILTALKEIHKAGFLYGDISPNNIFFAECVPESGKIGSCYFVDFGSAKPLVDEVHTEIMEAAEIFSTEGYRAPEIIFAKKSNSGLRLSIQTDIYAVGCLLLHCVLPANGILALGNAPVIGRNTLFPSDGKKIGCSQTALKLLNEILEKSLCLKAEERYMGEKEHMPVHAMLSDIQELKMITKPPRYVLAKNLSLPDYFVPQSRKKEIVALKEAVNKGENVFLWGVGGIGKTETAIQLAGELNAAKGIYLVHFRNSMKETILGMEFSGYRYKAQKNLGAEEHKEAEYRERLRILHEEYRDAVIIVDHFDCEGKTIDELRGEEAFREFLGLDIRRIFTTRYVMGRKEWEIKELPEQELVKMMRYYCQDPLVTDEQFKKLIQAVNGHTLTLTLIAKTLKESLGEITPEVILEAFEKGKISRMKYPKVVSDKNREYRQRQIYEHLKVLFDVSVMNKNTRAVLKYATLFPEKGMDNLLLRRCLKPEEQEIVSRLVKCGWLEYSKDQGFRMHPVIRQVAREELKTEDEKCRSFLNILWKECSDLKHDLTYFQQIKECYENAYNYLDDLSGEYLCRAGEISEKIGNFKEALCFIQKAMESRENLPNIDKASLVEVYRLAAKCYRSLIKYEEEILYLHKALSCEEKKCLHTAIYCEIAIAYDNMNMHEKTLAYCKKALWNYRKSGSKDEVLILMVYFYMWLAYKKNDNVGQTEFYYKKIFKIIKKMNINCQKQEEIVKVYGILARIYKAKGNSQGEMACYKEILEIQKKILSEAHPELGKTYTNIGRIYTEYGCYKDAEENLKKAESIYKRGLPFGHRVKVELYQLFADLYYRLRDYPGYLNYKCELVELMGELVRIDDPVCAEMNPVDIDLECNGHWKVHSRKEDA